MDRSGKDPLLNEQAQMDLALDGPVWKGLYLEWTGLNGPDLGSTGLAQSFDDYENLDLVEKL